MTLEALEARKTATLKALRHAQQMRARAVSEAAIRRHSRRVVVALDTLASLATTARLDFGVRLNA